MYLGLRLVDVVLTVLHAVNEHLVTDLHLLGLPILLQLLDRQNLSLHDPRDLRNLIDDFEEPP